MADQDICFQLPASAVKKQPGFAFDIGGTLAKLVYIDNTSKCQDVVKIRSKVFKKSEVSDLIQFIKENCQYSGIIELESTGFNTFANKQLLEKELNLSIKIVNELNCYSRAVVHCVKNYPLEDVFYPQHPEAAKSAQQSMESFEASALAGMGDVDKGDKAKDPPKNMPAMTLPNHHILDHPDDKKHFPCLVVMLGSGIAFYMVTEDGKHHVIDCSHTGGRTFLAMCHFLLGTTDFDKIMEMAEKGDSRNIDFTGKDFKKGFVVKDGENIDEAKIYLTYPDNEPVFYTEKAVDSDGSFKKEDIAQSYWYITASQIIQTVVLMAKCQNFKRIFITGGLARHEYARRTLEKHIITGLRMWDRNTEEKTLYGFLRNGEFYGALGVILSV